MLISTDGFGQKTEAKGYQEADRTMRKIANGCVRALLALMASLLLPMGSVSAQSHQRTEVASNSYSLKEAVFGYKDEPLGDLIVCVVVTTGVRTDRTISVSVKLPDSGRILMLEAPVTQRANGDIFFEFDDDGWGNAGRGALTTVGDKAQLDLTQTTSPPDADRNIGRNYGRYLLSKQACQ